MYRLHYRYHGESSNSDQSQFWDQDDLPDLKGSIEDFERVKAFAAKYTEGIPNIAFSYLVWREIVKKES